MNRTQFIEDGGGSAFPRDDDMSVIVQHYGLSKLDWFAGQALAGFTVSQLTFRMLNEDNEVAEEIAGLCYQLAEAMMTIREVAHGE